MDSPELNAQLKALAEEKEGILRQIGALQKQAERQALQASRRQELEEWLGQQPMVLDGYDDKFTRRLVERITVVDAETIRVKLRDMDVEIEQGHTNIELAGPLETVFGLLLMVLSSFHIIFLFSNQG